VQDQSILIAPTMSKRASPRLTHDGNVTEAYRAMPMPLLIEAKKPQGLFPRLEVVSERTAHGGRHRQRSRGLDATHVHAGMLRLEDHEDAERPELADHRVSDLRGETLLQLGPTGVTTHAASDLGESGDATVPGDVAHMSLAHEG